MNRKLTLTDISDAIKLLRKEPWHTIENDVCKLEVSDAGVETIQLKRLGKEIIDSWIEENNFKQDNGVDNGVIGEIFGIKVVVSNDVGGLR